MTASESLLPPSGCRSGAVAPGTAVGLRVGAAAMRVGRCRPVAGGRRQPAGL